ncbi:MAG: hypothetical protein EXR05_11990 [Acetobacteraceae bacterium]|nr:hypothetical protein [Acetobacteraceae bacterium]MSP30498.1 hypothetical protein [Acetobacteraceae bacterium]
MLGLIEFSLFLVPIAIYAIWRVTAAEGGPSPRALITGAIMVLVLAVFLLLYIREERMDPNAAYIPPKLQDGRLIPGHTALK